MVAVTGTDTHWMHQGQIAARETRSLVARVNLRSIQPTWGELLQPGYHRILGVNRDLLMARVQVSVSRMITTWRQSSARRFGENIHEGDLKVAGFIRDDFSRHSEPRSGAVRGDPRGSPEPSCEAQSLLVRPILCCMLRFEVGHPVIVGRE